MLQINTPYSFASVFLAQLSIMLNFTAPLQNSTGRGELPHRFHDTRIGCPSRLLMRRAQRDD